MKTSIFPFNLRSETVWKVIFSQVTNQSVLHNISLNQAQFISTDWLVILRFLDNFRSLISEVGVRKQYKA